jgi:hypothetical protein
MGIYHVPQIWKVLAVFTGFYEHPYEENFQMLNSGRLGASGEVLMRKRIYCLAVLAGSASGLFAQSFTGTWQGALKIPQAPRGELRILLKIETTDKDTLAAQFYRIDQDPTPIKTDSVKKSGRRINFCTHRCSTDTNWTRNCDLLTHLVSRQAVHQR